MRLSFLRILLATLLIASFVTAGTASAAPSTGLDTGAGPWQWVRPPVQGSVVEAVSFVGAGTGWAVGLDGLILKTTDSGATWAAQVSGTTYNLTGVKFVDANNGWAIGTDGATTANVIVHTTNGGATWTTQATPASGCPGATACNNIHLSGISFISTTRGIIVGDGYAFYTTNGGTTWTAGTAISSSDNLTAVQMLDTSNAWAVGNGGAIYWTTTGGATWNKLGSSPTTNNLTALFFTDSEHGFAVGSTGGLSPTGRLLRFSGPPGSPAWSASTATTAAALMGVTVPGTAPGSALIAAGGNGTIYKNTTNIWTDPLDTLISGMSTPASGTISQLLCVTAASSTAIYAGGDGGAITASTDTGSTWNMKAGGDSLNMTASSFVSGTEGWVAGDNGTVVHTTDGGANWSNDNSGIPSDADIHGIHFLNNTTGFAVGCQGVGCPSSGNGVAYKYSSGTWTSMSTPVLGNIALNSVHMTDSTHGWAVGASSTALRTSDGANWVSAATGIPAGAELNSVDSTDATSDGWAVGQVTGISGPAGVVYKYSGGSWSSTGTPASPPTFLTSIDMIDGTTGYMVGSGGTVFKTTNTGTSWVAKTSGTSKLLAAVSFIPGNANIGFAVGEFGRVIHTRNAGDNWSAENLGTNLNMLTVSTMDERTAYTGGDSGAVLRSLRPYYFTWYDDAYANNWVLMANPNGAASDLWFNLYIGGVQRAIPGLSGTECAGGPYAAGQVPAGCTAYGKYNGVLAGPVNAASLTSDKAIVSQRILWPKGGSSMEEVLGQDVEKLSDHFYWTWYDQASAGYKNWVLVSNPNPFPIYYDLWIGGTQRVSVQVVQPGANSTPQFAGVINGPVELKAYNTSGRSAPATVMASQRVLMNSDNAFNEVPGIPAGELSSDYYWTWYDQFSAGAKNWVLVANPPGDAATNIYYRVTIRGAVQNDGSAPAGSTCKGPIADNSYRAPQFNGIKDGPVEVQTYSDSSCSAAANAIATQRVTWNNGLSFEEVPGFPAASLTDTYHWTWYDQVSAGMTNWVLVANPSAVDTLYYEISIGGTVVNSGDITPATKYVTPTFPSQIGGPVKVQAWTDSGKTAPRNVITSQRVLFNGYFNEVLGTVLN